MKTAFNAANQRWECWNMPGIIYWYDRSTSTIMQTYYPNGHLKGEDSIPNLSEPEENAILSALIQCGAMTDTDLTYYFDL